MEAEVLEPSSAQVANLCRPVRVLYFFFKSNWLFATPSLTLGSTGVCHLEMWETHSLVPWTLCYLRKITK